MHRRIRLLNVDVDDVTMDELVDSFREGMLLTLHVDMIMKLQKDREFYRMLPRFDVVTCDSQILFVASKLLGTPFRERVSGSDFFPRFCARHKDDPGVTVFICGGGPGVAEIARKNVNATAGREMVVGTDSPPLDYETRPGEVERMGMVDEVAGVRKGDASAVAQQRRSPSRPGIVESTTSGDVALHQEHRTGDAR